MTSCTCEELQNAFKGVQPTDRHPTVKTSDLELQQSTGVEFQEIPEARSRPHLHGNQHMCSITQPWWRRSQNGTDRDRRSEEGSPGERGRLCVVKNAQQRLESPRASTGSAHQSRCWIRRRAFLTRGRCSSSSTPALSSEKQHICHLCRTSTPLQQELRVLNAEGLVAREERGRRARRSRRF